MELRDLNYGDVLAAIFATITVVAALGEGVFHWRDQPGGLVTGASLVLTLLAAGSAASRRQAKRLPSQQGQMLA